MPTTVNRAISLNWRDGLRKEYDTSMRCLFVRLSRYFPRLPSRMWVEIRRDPQSAARPWGPFFVLIDDLARAGVSEEELFEIDATVHAYIATRCAMRELTPSSSMMPVPEQMREAA